MNKFEPEKIKLIADLYYEYHKIDSHMAYSLSEIITGDYDTDTDPVSSTGYDDYDNSLEIMFGPHIALDYSVSRELADFVIKECGFSRAWFNFLDGTEQFIYIDRLKEGDGWVNGEVKIAARKSVSYDKKRLERYIKNNGESEDEKDLLEKWKNYQYITPAFPHEMNYPTKESCEQLIANEINHE